MRTPHSVEQASRLSIRENPLKGGSLTQTTSQDAAREAVRILRDLGITDPDDVLRLGALAMVRRAVAAAEQRGKNSPAYTRKIVLNGGPYSDDTSPSALLRELGIDFEIAA